jgi:hypothetical protein
MKRSCCGVFFDREAKSSFYSLYLGKMKGKGMEAARNALRLKYVKYV